MLANATVQAIAAPAKGENVAADPDERNVRFLIGAAEYIRTAAVTMLAEGTTAEGRAVALNAQVHIDLMVARELARLGRWLIVGDYRYTPLRGTPPDFKRELMAGPRRRAGRATEAVRSPKVYAVICPVVGPDGRVV